MHPEQIQDFIPLPLTLSGVIYYTQEDPFSGKSVYVAKTFRERKMQRALIQYRNPANRPLIREAFEAAKCAAPGNVVFGDVNSPSCKGSQKAQPTRIPIVFNRHSWAKTRVQEKKTGDLFPPKPKSEDEHVFQQRYLILGSSLELC